ncbi:MAG TPA: hypothetical protein VL443_21555 [Cyclobacteriaceae bacterium]|nr:hypothetical protein [Cyclobacteriaceae bacterium]
MKIIRVLIFSSYLLPFIFLAYGCDGVDLIQFYKEEEFENWRREHPTGKPVEEIGTDSIVTETVDTTSLVSEIGMDTTGQSSVKTSITTSSPTIADEKKDYIDLISTTLVFPSESSLSAIGVMILYQSDIGRTMIFISFFGSIIILVLSFIKKQKPEVELIIHSISILSLLSFIWISVFMVKTDLLWGFWLCLLLNSIGIVWQLKKYRVFLISKNT